MVTSPIKTPEQLFELAKVARKSLEGGLPVDECGRHDSAGSCLHGCLLFAVLLKSYTSVQFVIRGGSEAFGALDMRGNLQGHYWVEASLENGEVFIVDLTADQFGYLPVVVLPLNNSRDRYISGSQDEIDETFFEIAEEFNLSDLFPKTL